MKAILVGVPPPCRATKEPIGAPTTHEARTVRGAIDAILREPRAGPRRNGEPTAHWLSRHEPPAPRTASDHSCAPEPIKDWSLTSLKEKLIKIGAKPPLRHTASNIALTYGRTAKFKILETRENASKISAFERYGGSRAGFRRTEPQRKNPRLRASIP